MVNWINWVIGGIVVYGIAALIIKAIPAVKAGNMLLPVIKIMDKIVTRKKPLTK